MMGITTIAECVEMSHTLAILRDIGVDYAQGFAIALPRPYLTAHDALRQTWAQVQIGSSHLPAGSL